MKYLVHNLHFDREILESFSQKVWSLDFTEVFCIFTRRHDLQRFFACFSIGRRFIEKIVWFERNLRNQASTCSIQVKVQKINRKKFDRMWKHCKTDNAWKSLQNVRLYAVKNTAKRLTRENRCKKVRLQMKSAKLVVTSKLGSFLQSFVLVETQAAKGKNANVRYVKTAANVQLHVKNAAKVWVHSKTCVLQFWEALLELDYYCKTLFKYLATMEIWGRGPQFNLIAKVNPQQ